MRLLRYTTLTGGLLILIAAFGFIFQLPFEMSLWPWEDGRYSYLFIGSILAAVSAAAFWIGWSGEFGALPAGSLNIFVIGLTTSIYFFKLTLGDSRSDMIPYAIIGLFIGIAGMISFLWSRRIPLGDSRPTPALVRISFGFFTASLIFAGVALILRKPIFPWALNSDTSIIFGCIFLGDAFYFLYGLILPRWYNALGQLLSFLAYDLVLIVPFLSLVKSVQPEHFISLIAYLIVLIYSSGLAIYFLFINSQTRFGS
jgi:hypothetical protein